jgi:predicted TIM-barrel fold metal-dependent hydrolase
VTGCSAGSSSPPIRTSSEPPDLWTERIDRRYRDRAPHVVAESDADWWFIDGVRTNSFQGGAQAGKRFESPDELRPAARFREVRPGAYLPGEFLRDNDLDGVHGSIIYPTEGLQLFRVHDDALLTAVFRAYNDWLVEFCRTDPARLRSYDHPQYEPFWAAAQDLAAPLSLHIDTNRPAPGTQRESMKVTRPSSLANADHWVRVSLGHLIFTGVFERYPRLRVGSVEHELSWAPHFLDRLDYTYTQRARRESWHRYEGDALPSDFFHRNVFLSFQEDHLGMRDRALIGVDQLLWGSDYPHTESTFPRSRTILERILAGVPEEEQRKITQGNAARLYGF